MVEIIEESGQTVADWEKKAKAKGIKVSGGYLRKAAKNGTSIGIDLVDYFLDEFSDVNTEWLIKGTGIRRNTETTAEKHTPATNKDEAGVIKDLKDKLAKEKARGDVWEKQYWEKDKRLNDLIRKIPVPEQRQKQ